MPVSESEKHRGNVLSCRFSDKAEHVPIKKRRFFFRSPSPPPKIPSPNNEENTSPRKTEDDPVQSAVMCPASPKAELGKMSVKETHGRSNYPKKVNKKLECNEDFSGISILAAAACSSSLGRVFGYSGDGSGVEEPSVHEGPVEVSTNSEAQSLSEGLVREDFVNTSDISIGGASSCVTTALVGELAATSTAECASSGDGAPTVSSDISSMKDEDIVGSQKLHSQDDRLHWDLNVVMDTWEQPFDYQDSHSSDCISQGRRAAIRCDVNTKRAEAHDLLSEPENSQCKDKRKLLPCEPRGSVEQISQGNANNQVIDYCNHKNQPLNKCDMSISSECKNVLSSLVDNSDSVQALPSRYVCEKPPLLNSNRCADNEPIGESMNSDMVAPVFTDLRNLSGPCVPNTNCTVVSVGAAVMKNTRVSAVDTQVRLTVLPTLDIQNKDTPKSTLSDKPFDDKRHCLKDDSDVHTYIASKVDNDVSMEKVEKEIDGSQRSHSMHEFTVASDIKVKGDDFSMDGSEQAGTDVQASIKEVMMNSAQHLEQKFISDASCDPCSPRGTEAAGELHEDYDSQYEDGELRESTGHVWEEYDAVDGEAERINYGFNNSRYSVGASDPRVSGSGQVRKTKDRNAGNADNMSSVSGVGDELCAEPDMPITDDKDHGRDDNLLRGPASNELLESNKISSTTVRDDCDGEGRIYHHGTRSKDSETDTRTGSRLYRRGLMSRIERPVGDDMSSREDRAENRSKFDGISARWERGSTYVKSSERVRYSMQGQHRTRQVNSWNGSSDGCRGIKQNYSPSYPPQDKPNDDETIAEDRDTINAISYSSHPSTNDESIADGDAAINFKSVHKLDGDLGSDRLMSRGRFFRYGPKMDRSAGRARYHVPSPDDAFQSSLKYRRPLTRRDRSVSPNERRGYPFAHQSHARCSSRSRTRSPDPRLSPRGRSGDGNCGGVYLRHRSRSPNFRSEARMLRMRSPPHHQFGTDHMTEFSPFQRDHGSPPSSRWMSGRKDEVGHFNYKQRAMLDRSPGRIHLRGNRENFLDSARNSKPDVYYRLNTARISDMDVTGRAPRLEGNYENRRRQFGPNHPTRRGYDQGIAKRLHHDDGGFVSTNRDVPEFHGRGVRGVDNQNEDMPKRFRGNATYMYDRDGKFSSNSKLFRFDGIDSSRNLKPEESYRSMNPGRFNEVDRAARGHRYVDSYDDRRRYYGSINLPRRSEMEGIGRRLSHDVGDNLPVSRSSWSDDATDCHGRNARGIDGHVDVLPRRQREEQQLDFSGQEKKLSDTSMSTDVQVPAESEAVKGNSPS